MENLKSIIVLNDVEFESIQYANDFNENLINKSEDFAFIPEREIKTFNKLSFNDGAYQLNVIYIRSPFSKNEFLKIDSELNIEKELEHNLKILFTKLGATSYKRINYDEIKNSKENSLNIKSKNEAEVNTWKGGVNGGVDTNINIDFDNQNKHFHSLNEEVIFTGLPDSDPKEKYESAKKFASEKNLLVIQDVRHLLETFNPDINNGNVIKERAIKSISFEFVKSSFEATLNLAIKCKAVLITPKIGSGISSENELKATINRQKESLTIKELVVKF